MIHEPEITIQQQDGSVLIRSGYCSGCGECCAGDPFNGQEGVAKIVGACPLLGLHGCTNKDHRYYKNACTLFPQHPSQIIDKPSCTYTFREA